jgi:isochorismate pyruvate lyase
MAAEVGKDGAKSETEGDWRDGCTSLADVRANIDRLDALIVPLLCERHHFVTAAAKFKPSVEGVVVVSRVEEIIRRVRDIAATKGVNPDTIETVYRTLIDAFTRDEQAHWRKLHK